MTFAPPVSRGNFHYNGNLYVEVGNFNRHERATVEEITAILRPDLKKHKKASIDPPKDQVGHWYEAQLIHYGLPPSKDKARAKMRLLEALNSSAIVVPPNITAMEAEMKKEYAAAERKAKAQYKASRVPAKESEPPAVGKKRKQSEPSGNINNINVNISLGNDFGGPPGAFSVTHGQQPAKKAKTTPSKSKNKKPEEIAYSKPSKKTTGPRIEQPLPQAQSIQQRPKQTAKPSAKLREAWLKDPSIGAGPVNPAGFGYSMTPSSGFSLAEGHLPNPSSTNLGAIEADSSARKEPIVKKQPRVKQESKVERKPQIKKEVGVGKEPKIKKEVKVKKEPSTRPSSQINDEPDTDWSRNPSSPPLGLINGLYDLSCPTVEDGWSCTDLKLILTLDGTTMWGAYDLGMFSGIIFLPNRPLQASNEPLPFTWCGRENGEGEMSFGQGCKGEISFLGNGNIEGWISVYGRCSFKGVRIREAGTMVRSSRSMKEEWEGYNERAYEEERTGRW